MSSILSVTYRGHVYCSLSEPRPTRDERGPAAWARGNSKARTERRSRRYTDVTPSFGYLPARPGLVAAYIVFGCEGGYAEDRIYRCEGLHRQLEVIAGVVGTRNGRDVSRFW